MIENQSFVSPASFIIIRCTSLRLRRGSSREKVLAGSLPPFCRFLVFMGRRMGRRLVVQELLIVDETGTQWCTAIGLFREAVTSCVHNAMRRYFDDVPQSTLSHTCSVA